MDIRFTGYWNTLRNTSAKVVCQQGGSSSGKSYTTMQLLIFYCCTQRNIVVTCSCSTYPQVYRGIYRDAVNIINTNPFFKAMIPEISRNGFTVPSTGSILEFSAYPTREAAKAGKRDYLFCDELTNWSEEIFFELELRTKKQTFVAWNPNSKFWVHKLFEGKDDETCKWIYSTYRANPFCDQKIIDSLEALKDTDLNRYKVYCLGETGATTGTVFTDWSVIGDEDFPLPEECKWCAFGLDFGWKDPTAIVESCFCNGAYYIREINYSGLDNLEIAELFKRLDSRKTQRVICDSAEPRAIAELVKLGVRAEGAKKGPDSIKLGIDAMKRYHIFITRSSKNLESELLSYSYKQDALGNYTSEPVGGLDHLLDAARYTVLNMEVAGHSALKTRLGRL